jgi:hypothetical protein
MMAHALDLDDLLGKLVSQVKTLNERVDELERQPAPMLDLWTDYSATSTIVGWASFTIKALWYKKVSKLVLVQFDLMGTSNSVNTSFTLPLAAANPGIVSYFYVVDGGAGQTIPGVAIAAAGSSLEIFYKDSLGTLWTATGGKRIYGEFFYQAA